MEKTRAVREASRLLLRRSRQARPPGRIAQKPNPTKFVDGKLNETNSFFLFLSLLLSFLCEPCADPQRESEIKHQSVRCILQIVPCDFPSFSGKIISFGPRSRPLAGSELDGREWVLQLCLSSFTSQLTAPQAPFSPDACDPYSYYLFCFPDARFLSRI